MANSSAKISLIIGLALPAVVVIVIAALVFLPSVSITPSEDFIYVAGPYPSYTTWSGSTSTQHDISIKNGKIVQSATSYTVEPGYPAYPQEKVTTPRFFIHHTTQNTNEEISFDDIATVTLSPNRTSPQGFTLTFGKQSYGVFPFFISEGTDRDRAYLSTKRASKEINLVSDTSINFYEFQLVGWVIPTP